MNQEIQSILDLMNDGQPEEALDLFGKLPVANDVDYWLTKGSLEQKFQKWGEAINAYLKVLEIDAHNREAQNNLHMIENILNFWNPEMHNP